MVFFGSLYLKEVASRNSRNKQASTPLMGFPMGRPNFCL